MEPSTTSSSSRPVTATRGVIGLYVSFAIAVLVAIYNYFTKLASGAVNDEHISVALVLTINIVTILIMFFFIYKISQGRNWARIIYFILFMIGLLIMPFTIPVLLEQDLLVFSVLIIQTIIQIIAWILLFQKETTAWFKTQ